MSGLPRIAALFDDLDPSRSGVVGVRSSADRLVVAWQAVPEYADSGTGAMNTFQITLFATGTIEIAYQEINSQQGVVGISPGQLTR